MSIIKNRDITRISFNFHNIQFNPIASVKKQGPKPTLYLSSVYKQQQIAHYLKLTETVRCINAGNSDMQLKLFGFSQPRSIFV